MVTKTEQLGTAAPVRHDTQVIVMLTKSHQTALAYIAP